MTLTVAQTAIGSSREIKAFHACRESQAGFWPLLFLSGTGMPGYGGFAIGSVIYRISLP